MTLATSSAVVILWPSAIVVSPLIGSLVEPTSLTPRWPDLAPGLRDARYTTSTYATFEELRSEQEDVVDLGIAEARRAGATDDLGRQALDAPALACATETQPVVQAVVAL